MNPISTDTVTPWPGVELPVNWRGLEAGLVYDAEAAEGAVRFFSRYMRHHEGELGGKPFDLAPWQASRIVRPIFGLKRDDGLRAIRRVFVEVPRKNGKSLLASGLACKMLFADREPGARVISAAVDREQASIVYESAARSVASSPGLAQRSRVFLGNNKRIVTTRGGIYRVVSADGRRAHGQNLSAVICDELHAWKGSYQGSLLEALSTSTSSRRQPLEIIITTAGYDRNSMCYQEYTRACAVRDGLFARPSYLPVIYEAPADADWRDPEVWAAANPGLGISKRVEYMREKAELAADLPSELNTFKRLELDIWTEQSTIWIPREAWAACADPELAFPDGAVCSAGLDLSTTTDTTAVVLAWQRPDGRIAIWPHAFIPEATVDERERVDVVPYRDWAARGLCTLTPGNVISYDAVLAYFLECSERCTLTQVAFDPWNAEHFRQRLEQSGFQTVEFRQGWRTMGEPTAMFQRFWREGRLVHSGDELLAYQASCAAVLEDPAGNIKPAKDRSRSRIDEIVGGIMAVWLLIGGDLPVEADEVIQ